MIDTPHIVQTAAQSTAVIHITVPRDQIRHVMGPGHTELMAVLGAQRIVPTGSWFTRHFKIDPEVFDFEIGVPTKETVAPAGRVTAGQLPATIAARTIYHGPYEGLAAGWKEFDAWIVAQGRKTDPSLWETYLTDPSADPDTATWRTEFTRPLTIG
jgi:effector-binding domain-containing protein